jgi:DNA-binding FrmR family transcriptional regulator
MDGRELADRQFDALLERLDRIATQLERIDGRLEQQEAVHHVVRELRGLNESLQALAYAALGQTPPQVRRRRTG